MEDHVFFDMSKFLDSAPSRAFFYYAGFLSPSALGRKNFGEKSSHKHWQRVPCISFPHAGAIFPLVLVLAWSLNLDVFMTLFCPSLMMWLLSTSFFSTRGGVSKDILHSTLCSLKGPRGRGRAVHAVHFSISGMHRLGLTACHAHPGFHGPIMSESNRRIMHRGPCSKGWLAALASQISQNAGCRGDPAHGGLHRLRQHRPTCCGHAWGLGEAEPSCWDSRGSNGLPVRGKKG